jgi:hypothetical protein
MPKVNKYTILAGSWFDRKAGAVKAVGDVVEFTDKQADVFGRRNLRGPDDAQPAAPVVDPALTELQAELAELTKAKAAVDTELTELKKAKAAVDTELTKVKADLAKATKA